MGSKKIWILLLVIILAILIIGFCIYQITSVPESNIINETSQQTPPQTNQTMPNTRVPGTENITCDEYYLMKFGMNVNEISIIDTDCEWTPNSVGPGYSIVDSLFEAQFKDMSNNEYNLFYQKGCCWRHGAQGFTFCIMSKNGETALFNQLKSMICNKLGNDPKCINGEYEKKVGGSIILSVKHDHENGNAANPVITIFVDSGNCLDIA